MRPKMPPQTWKFAKLGLALVSVAAAIIYLRGRSSEISFPAELVCAEASYFRPAIAECGLIVDHVQADGGTGAYHAASKSGFQIAVLLKVIQGTPGLTCGWLPGAKPEVAQHDARRSLLTAIKTLDRFQGEHPELRGFIPWGQLTTEGIEPWITERSGRRCVELPAIDQGILAYSLAATVAELSRSSVAIDREIAERARCVLGRLDFGDFYDPVAGQLSGRIFVFADGWERDPHYFLDDFSESLLPVAYGILHGQVPEFVVDTCRPRLIDPTAAGGDAVTFKTWRASFHEIGIPLLFLPRLRETAPELYANYLNAHVRHATSEGLVGFTATAYINGTAGQPQYAQLGLKHLSKSRQVDSETHAVFYANCLAALIDEQIGLEWASRYRSAHSAGRFGAWESVDKSSRPTRIYTTDAKSMSVLALTGGLGDSIDLYFKTPIAELQRPPMSERWEALRRRLFRHVFPLHEQELRR